MAILGWKDAGLGRDTVLPEGAGRLRNPDTGMVALESVPRQPDVKMRIRRRILVTTVAADRELDVRGLNCPLPILRAKKALTDLQSGQVLKVMATDPGSVKDFQAFCRQTGNELLSHSEGPEYVFFMKKR
jgi:tRNA 2-thiouridine synthesizing protein A